MTESIKLDKGRRLARRYMAYVSFHFLLLFGGVVTAALLYSGDRKEIAEALSGGLGAVAGVISTFTLIVLAYLGVSLAEAMKKGPES